MEENKSAVNSAEKKELSLIIAIVDKGNTDLVMNAARAAGARGGTIAGARGTADPDMAKFYGISISPEKEMVYMVVEKKDRDKIMKKIYEDAGMGTKGMGILFSLPITDSYGLLKDGPEGPESSKE